MIRGPVLLGSHPVLLKGVRELFHSARNAGEFDELRTEPNGGEWIVYSGPADAVHGFALVSYAGPGMAAVEPLWVSKDHRRKGLASALLKAACVAARGQGIRTVMFGIEPGAPMQAIAERDGFAKAGIIMTKGL